MSRKNDFSKLEIIQKVDELKSAIDKLRPIKPEDENRIMQKFRLDWNYNSNAIEGNSLTYGETRAFLMHGITAKGKPFKDYLDIRGHNEAIDYLSDFINKKEELTEAVIREIHKIILVEPYEVDALTPDGKPTRRRIEIGVYKKQPNHVKTQTGEIHYFASPEETPAKMEELMNWYRKENKNMHPLILASFFHHRFAAIHPFDDGNGRMARLLMNLILMQSHFTPAVIRQNDRENYYSVLSQADAGEYLPFIEYIGEYLIHLMEIFIKGAKGDDIEEPDDLDKEIELFTKEIEGKDNFTKMKKSMDSIDKVLENSIIPILETLMKTVKKLKELFHDLNLSIIKKDYKGILHYEKFNAISPIERFLYHVNDSSLSSPIILSMQLKEFKEENNPFSLELNLYAGFNEYKYSFALFVTSMNELENLESKIFESFLKSKGVSITEKYYHQYLASTESELIAKKVGKALFARIKELSKNKDVT